ncbi:MAG: efflux RND transporter periplasmic adaptor subunit [Desulfobacterales bacterium]|nr:efflux RND transporter periplasmic adaptor subunit [Desulfobacterales bacterium]
MGKRKRILKFIRKKSPIAVVGLIVAASIAAARLEVFNARQTPAGNHATFEVKRGPLRISVIESGTIKAREQIVIKNMVEGRTSILFLVPEGISVKKGDLLVELDASNLMDKKIEEQIREQNTEAAFISAREELAVVENQARSDVEKAELAFAFAREDQVKYLQGEYPNQLKESNARLTLANEELIRSGEKLEWSRKLFKEKYISNTELQADELAMKTNALNVELAQNNLGLLINFTHKRTREQLESDLKQAEMALDRERRKAKANVAQTEAGLKAKKAEYQRQQDKLKKVDEQIKMAKIYAPAEGLVIYATSAQSGGGRRGRRSEPLDEGQEVRERQELIHLPTTASFMVEVAIHEASLNKIRKGLPVKVTVDALPGKIFTGRVARIAPLPDPQSSFLNPDLKLYNTAIHLDAASSDLRHGMSCTAEIVIEEFKEAIYVPVQAVLRVGRQATVYTVKNNQLEPVKVDIGLDNNRMVQVISGLEPGQVVSLTPPLALGAVRQAADEMIFEKGPDSADPGAAPQTGGERSQAGRALEKKRGGQTRMAADGPETGDDDGLAQKKKKKKKKVSNRQEDNSG